MSKIVILSGSPRKNGATDRLTDAFVEGAKASGHTVSCFHVAALQIHGCLGCNHCFDEPGVCVQKDDMLPILARLRQADVLALASPVYYFGVSSQLKQAIDRTFALLKEGTPIKRALILLACGAADASAADSSVSMFRQIAAFQKWQEIGVLVAPGLHDRNDIEGREELRLAEKLGREIL
jgi:multimeric flavodoxin WrbA